MARPLLRARLIAPVRPDRAARALWTLRRWGSTPAAAYAISAATNPDRPGLIDERGTLTFGEVHERSNALAHAFAQAGVRAGDGVALMCRNHRGLIEATVACFKLGANAIFLNTAFAAPQLAGVLERERPRVLVYDEEFTGLLSDDRTHRARFVAWSDGDKPADPMLDDLIAAHPATDVKPPPDQGRIIILTSGTTGTPKGAARRQPDSLEPLAAILSSIPLRAREPTLISAPLFHTWGYGVWTMGLALSSTSILQRRFDPEAALQAISDHRATAWAVIPVMLQRTLDLPPEVIARYSLRTLRIIAASGSALQGDLATRVMDTFGDVLYNIYGSTEVAYAAIAGPRDMRAAPGTAGHPPPGTIVRLFGDDDSEVAPGETGRIFVGSEMLFDSYTGGGDRARIGGLMSTGDIGHVDAAGRLFVDGRDDEMIVSGGENVFPSEIEDLLARHDAIKEAAALPVEDDEFGQRLRAFVVLEEGHTLSDEDVKAYVRGNLARYKVPREVVFMDELPRNATGKILKRVLAEERS